MKEDNAVKKVGIIMGSDSDLPVVGKAADVLKEFGVPYEMHIYSAHRTPVEARDFCVNARANGFGVIIAAAGMAAHLAGAMAAGTTLPVIGIIFNFNCFSIIYFDGACRDVNNSSCSKSICYIQTWEPFGKL